MIVHTSSDDDDPGFVRKDVLLERQLFSVQMWGFLCHNMIDGKQKEKMAAGT